MDDTPERLATKPSWLIAQLAVHTQRLAFDAFGAVGSRGYHYRILAALAEFGPSSQADLGRRCRIDRSDVVAAVNQLVEQGFVERAPDPSHGRRNRVSLTGGGEQRLARLDAALDQMQNELLKPLTTDERRTLTSLLSRALDHHQP